MHRKYLISDHMRTSYKSSEVSPVSGSIEKNGDESPNLRSRRLIVVGVRNSSCWVPASMTQVPDGVTILVIAQGAPSGPVV